MFNGGMGLYIGKLMYKIFLALTLVLRFFEKNKENAFPKINVKYGSQKVLLKSFPMNGHVSMFRTFLGQFLCPAISDRSHQESLNPVLEE
jgi:hypothetical protein